MSAVDEKLCPFCGKPNGCQHGNPECWCNFEPIPKGLRALIPPHLAMKVCICRPCVLDYKRDPKDFALRPWPFAPTP